MACVADGCERGAEHRGMCGKHYQRWMKYGSFDLPERRRRPVPHGTLHGHNFHGCRCEACVAAIRAYRRQWTEAHRERVHEICVLKYYQLTRDEYDEMLAEQNNGCAICGGPPNHGERCKNFDVDHDHATGQVRGLLCNPCNRMIGRIEAGHQMAWPAGHAYLNRSA